MYKNLSLLLLIIFTASCISHRKKPLSIKLENVADSIKVQDIIIKNLFKYQILAHNNSAYNSSLIVEKVYKPHQTLWNNCYGEIFGEENGKNFKSAEGMIAWNKSLYPNNKILFDTKVNELLDLELNTLLKKNLKKFNQLVPYKPRAKISILFTPIHGIGFGGCSAEEFALELNSETDLRYTLKKGLPHELNHLVYEHFRAQDPNYRTALSQTIDEGFASYFTWVFFDRKEAKHKFVENMSEENWNWYLKNEKAIFEGVKAFFEDSSGNNPLLRNDRYQLFREAPKTLNYWLGFRIVEKYVERHGTNSWKDIYRLSSQDVLTKSGYIEYIDKL